MQDIKFFTEALKEYGANLNLLYVEDDELVRTSTAKLFSKFFNSVDTAEDGLLGLEKFKNNKYDLIVTDINMPNMNGIEMSQAIKEIEFRQNIVVISAHNESNFLLSLIDIGVDGFLLKPIKSEQLLKTLARICGNIADNKMMQEYQEKMESSFSEVQQKLEQKLYSENKNMALAEVMASNIEIDDQQLKFLTSASEVTSELCATDFHANSITDYANTNECLKELGKNLNSSIANFIKEKNDSTTQDLSQSLFIYAEELDNIAEFLNLAFALEKLSNTLNRVLFTQSLNSVESALESMSKELEIWRKSVLEDRDAKNIHELDRSVIARIMIIESSIS
ncbi:MAG: response regulator [Helicobacteraceae bacterium]|nr:response regulator [Helicobacteraceae bacterium]